MYLITLGHLANNIAVLMPYIQYVCVCGCVCIHSSLNCERAGPQGGHRSERTQLGQTSVFLLLHSHYIYVLHVLLFACAPVK